MKENVSNEKAKAISDDEIKINWLTALVDSAEDAIISKTLDGVITSWNKGAERIFGYSGAEIIGKPVLTLIPQHLHPEEEYIISKLKRGEKIEHYETVRVRKDGSLIDISLTISPIKTADGKIIGASKIARDITALKKAEEQRRASEKQFRVIADAFPVLIAYIDNETRYRFVNRRYSEWFGISPEKLVGKTVRELVGEKAYEKVSVFIEKVLSGEEVTFEQLLPYETARERYVRVNYIPDADEETNAVKGFFALVHDISESKKAEEELRLSEERLRLATSAAQMYWWEFDLEKRKVFYSENTKQILGFAPPENLEGNLALIHEEDRTAIKENFARALSEKAKFEMDLRFVNPRDGEVLWYNSQGIFVPASETENERYVGILQNITERKREELNRQFLLELGEKIRYGEFNSEKLLDEVTEKAGIYTNAARCLFIEINEAENRGTIKHEYCKAGVASVSGEYKISDYSPQTLEEIRNGRIIVNENAETDARTADIYKTTYEPYQERSYVSIPLFVDGKWTAIFWVSDDKARRWNKQEIALLETVGELAWLAVEKLRNDKALRESRERLQMAMDAAKIYSWEMNLANAQVEWSPNLEKVIGFALPTDYKTTVDDLVHPADREETSRRISEAIENGDAFESEFRLVNPYNGEIVWVLGQGTLIRGANGENNRFVGITQNITERKNAEREREELLRREQAARIEAEEASRLKDEFLATVSHELRTPLNAILGWAQMLHTGKIGQDQIGRAAETIYRNSKSQAQLIEDILDVSRVVTGKLHIEPAPITLAPVIEAAVETLRPAIEAKNIQLDLKINTEAKKVFADADRLQQVFWNLLSNAIKFTPEKGKVSIKLENGETEAKVVFADTGKGISKDFLPFVFERFRQADATTTRKYGGLGLGLAIVRHIVELHGGTVAVESKGDGKGTIFSVALPFYENSQAKKAEKTFAAESDFEKSKENANFENFQRAISGARILLLDDEADTLEVLSAILSLNGAEVVARTNVAEAFETIENWKPDIILSDIAMPEEDGYSFIKKLRALPKNKGGDIPAIALTAYVGVKDRTRVLTSGFQMYVAKPVEAPELLDAVASLVKKDD